MGETAPIDKLIRSQRIIARLEQGLKTVKVIVYLSEPGELTTTKDQVHQLQSFAATGRTIRTMKTSVLSLATRGEVKLRHRFNNLPAFSVEVTAQGLSDLLNDPWVKSIEPVEELKPLVKEGVALMGGMPYRSQFNGAGTAVAIIDDGVDYSHPDLGAGDFPNEKVIGGYDTGEDDADPYPISNASHGTACAGIVAGDTGGPYPYIGGVAPGAKLYALKITELGSDGQGKIFGDAITDAILWCTAHKNDDPDHPIVAINISVGGPNRYFEPCDDQESAAGVRAINEAISAGIAVFQPSGNNGYCDSMVAGACLSNVISVGAVYDSDIGSNPRPGAVGCISPGSCAGFGPGEGCGCDTGWCYVDETTAADQVPSYSNTAPFLDLLAASNNAYTTDLSGAAGAARGDYRDFGGTSGASPYAAGAAACVQSAAKAVTGHFLTPQEMRELLRSTGDPVTDAKTNPPISIPRINIAHAIDHLIEANDKTHVIFEETFATERLDPSTWIQVEGATVDDAGLDESSALYSLRLNGQPSGQDSIITRTIDLSSFAHATLSYWYQRTGGGNSPEANDDLVLAYNVGFGWRALSEHAGSGPDMNHFEKVDVELPIEALSPAFRLRISNTGLASPSRPYDDWFIDDIRIRAQPQRTVVFEDDFSASRLDYKKWQNNDGAEIDDKGLNEPSGPTSLRMNGHPSQGDSLISAALDLSDYTHVVLCYWYQRTGAADQPEPGDDLVVQYESASGIWQELALHPGDGPSMTSYEKVTIDLPTDALHSRFKLRLHSIGIGGASYAISDDWFVDDLSIEAISARTSEPGQP
jgi:hypothetical protein